MAHSIAKKKKKSKRTSSATLRWWVTTLNANGRTVWLSQSSHQIIWEKEILEGTSQPQTKAPLDTASLHLRPRQGAPSAAPAAPSRVQGQQRHFRASGHGCGTPLSSHDEKCSGSTFCGEHCTFWFQIHSHWPTGPGHRAVCGPAMGEWARATHRRPRARGFGLLQPQRRLPGQPATQPRLRICHVAIRKEETIGDASWKA